MLRAGALGDGQHPPVDVSRDAGEHPLGAAPSRSGQAARTRSWLPPMPPEVTTTACARSSKSPTAVAASWRRRGRASLGSSTAPRTPSTAPPVTVSASTRCRSRTLDPAGRDVLADPAGERLDHAGPGAPGDVEAGHRVAGPVRVVAAALGPADDREAAHALRVQPGPLLPGGELDVGRGPLPRPVVLAVAVEAGGAQPVLPGQVERVVDAHPPLLGGVDEEQPAEATRTPGRRGWPRSPGRAAAPAGRRRPARPWRPGRPARLRRR